MRVQLYCCKALASGLTPRGVNCNVLASLTRSCTAHLPAPATFLMHLTRPGPLSFIRFCHCHTSKKQRILCCVASHRFLHCNFQQPQTGTLSLHLHTFPHLSSVHFVLSMRKRETEERWGKYVTKGCPSLRAAFRFIVCRGEDAALRVRDLQCEVY